MWNISRSRLQTPATIFFTLPLRRSIIAEKIGRPMEKTGEKKWQTKAVWAVGSDTMSEKNETKSGRAEWS